MSQSVEDENFFSLLINISASSESNLERLVTSIRVFVKKYFDNKEFNEPSNALEIVMDCIMKSEAVLYTVYELENENITEEAKIEILYYKDLVLKSMFVLTNLDFFVKVLKDNSLYKDAYLLREKLKKEFIIDASRLGQDTQSGKFLNQENNRNKLFSDIKPVEYRKLKNNYLPNAGSPSTFKSQDKKETIEEISDTPEKKLSFLERAKISAKERNKDNKEDENSDSKSMRTAMGWEISQDLLDKDIYQ